MYIAGVDIGNSTTEVCIGKISGDGKMSFVSDAMTETLGIKGTVRNIAGVKKALEMAMAAIGKSVDDIDLIRLNEAAPVIGDTAMETITETIISDSTMVGHNPSTPAGEGLATGYTVKINNLGSVSKDMPVIVVVDDTYDYEKAAIILNTTKANVTGVVLKKDEAVLVYNRLAKKVPVIDEVERIDALPLGTLSAIEVSPGTGRGIRVLSNPYGIAKVFDLTPEETRQAIPIAKSLIGKRSALVIKSIHGGVKEKVLKAGNLTFEGHDGALERIGVDEGAVAIMAMVGKIEDLADVQAEEGSYVAEMLKRMKTSMADLTHDDTGVLPIKDLLAIDTFVPMKVKGALAGEVAMEKAVAIAAMVKAHELPMIRLAKALETQVKVPVKVAGVEAVMASVGALTTAGTTLPIAILDLGGGSTDAAIMDVKGVVKSMHLAGAGAFVTMMINEELALNNLVVSEWIKRYPLAKVDSLYHITHENGEVLFFKEPLPPELYGRVVLVKEDGYVPIITEHPMDKILATRRHIKEKVFVTNALRALRKVAPDGNIRKIPNVVLVGGSALDDEIPGMIQKALSDYNIVAGRADIRKTMGPRNAVATGLCMSWLSEVRK